MQSNRKKFITLNLINGEEIKDDLAIKILGWWTSPDLNLNHHINKIRGPTYKALSIVKPYLRYMNLDQRRQMIEAKVLSIPTYGIALYLGQSQQTKDRITTIFMRAYRAIYGKYIPMKTKNEYICRQMKMKTPRQIIIQESLKFISKVINTQMPGQIYKMMIFPRKPRKNARIEIDWAPKPLSARGA